MLIQSNVFELLCISIDGEPQSLRKLLFRFIGFMSIDCDLLTALLLSISFISWFRVRIIVKDVSSVISIGVLGVIDRCVSIRDWCAGDPNGDCCVPLAYIYIFIIYGINKIYIFYLSTLYTWIQISKIVNLYEHSTGKKCPSFC